MPNTANYAERWEPELLEILTQDSLISPFITTAVKWLSAKTFHFTQMSTAAIRATTETGAGTAESSCRRMFRSPSRTTGI